MYKSQWVSFHCTEDWAPNDTFEEKTLIMEWRGRAIEVAGLEHFEASNLQGIPAPFFHVQQCSNEKVAVKNAFWQLCPHEEAARGMIF